MVDVVQGVKNKDLVIFEDGMRVVCGDHLCITTDDGSHRFYGFVIARIGKLVEKESKHHDLCVVIGPMIMMRFVALFTKKLGISTVTNMNPIMMDGTEMCDAYRLIVGDEVRFACVDGPESSAHKIDSNQAMKRARTHASEEGREHLREKEGKTHHDDRGSCGG